MTIENFIKELRDELRVLPVEQRDEIINNFELQIERAKALGDSEADLLKVLDDPKKVAEKYIRDAVVEEEEVTETEKIVEVLENAEDPEVEIQPVTADFASVVNQYDIQKLMVSGTSVDVKVEAGHKLGFKFISYSHKGDLKYQIKDGQLNILHTGQKKTVRVHTIFDYMKKRKQMRNDELTIIWPKSLEELTVDLRHGKISLAHINAEVLKLHSSEGMVEALNVKSKSAEIKSAMGRLVSRNSQFDRLYMKTEMGKIILEDVAAEHYYVISELGSINLTGLKVESNVKAVSKMGAVHVKYKKAPKLTKVIAKANVGKVHNDLAKDQIVDAFYKAEYKSEMGSVKVSLV